MGVLRMLGSMGLAMVCLATGVITPQDDFGKGERFEQVTSDVEGIGKFPKDIPLYIPTWLPEERDGEPVEAIFYEHAMEGEYMIAIYDAAGCPEGESVEDWAWKGARQLGTLRAVPGLSPQPRDIENGEPVEKELLAGVRARVYADGTDVRWEQGGWEFRFVGSSGRWEELEAFAKQWMETTPAAEKGRVEIYQKSASFEWQKDGCDYTFEVYSLPLGDALRFFAGLERDGGEVRK